MSEENSATGAKLHLVPFHNDTLVTLEHEGTRYVAMRRVVENMGLTWQSQHVKLKDQSAKFACHDIVTHDASGRRQDMLCMPVEKLALWLATINANKVRTSLRDKIERYQAESAIALHDYWTKGFASRDGSAEEMRRQFDELRAHIFGLEARLSEAALVADSRHTVENYASVLQLLDEAGAVSKGRNGLNRKIGHALKTAALFEVAHGNPSPVKRDVHSKTWIYDRVFAERYMRAHGRSFVADHNAARMGQGVIQFPKRAKRRAEEERRPSA